MSPSTTSKTVFRGDTPTLIFTITDSAGAAFDLTNVVSARFMVKKSLSHTDAQALLNKACSIDTPATGGVCRVTLAAADTADAGSFTGELQLVFSGGVVLTAIQFTWTVTDDVIKATS